MPYLVRRISRAKWDNDDYDFLSDDNAPADAITSCLRTFENELSTWKINDLEELDKAILCIITGRNQENINSLQIIYFEVNEIFNRGLTLENTLGDTVISEYKNLHFDIRQLTYNGLGIIKDLVLDCLRNERCRTITKKSLKELLIKSTEVDKLFDKSLLHEKLQKAF